MNEQLQPLANTQEVTAKQEQEFRAQMIDAIAAESVGTVGLYTSLDLKPEEKNHMAEVQRARGSEPSERLGYGKGGGWGDYGERACGSVSKTGEVGEQIRFVPLEDDKVDIRYSFGHGGTTDGSGRPGNVLNIFFTLPKDRATELRTALHEDPSFILQVVERQAAEIGISPQRWNTRTGAAGAMKPAYYGSDRQKGSYALGVEDKDRVLQVIDSQVNGESQTDVAQEDLVYGENKSLASMLPKAAEVVPVEQSTAPEAVGQATPQTKQELAEQRFEEELALELQEVASDRSAGKSTQEIIDRLEGEILGYLDGEEAAAAKGSNTEPFDRAYRVAAEVQRELMAELKAEKAEAERKQSAVGEAQANLAAVHAEMVGPTVNSNVMHGGRQYEVVELYEGKDAQKTQWATLKSGSTEITVKASDLS